MYIKTKLLCTLQAKFIIHLQLLLAEQDIKKIHLATVPYLCPRKFNKKRNLRQKFLT